MCSHARSKKKPSDTLFLTAPYDYDYTTTKKTGRLGRAVLGRIGIRVLALLLARLGPLVALVVYTAHTDTGY